MQKFGVFRWHYYSENFADTEYNSPYRFEKEGWDDQWENMECVIGEHILKPSHFKIKFC